MRRRLLAIAVVTAFGFSTVAAEEQAKPRPATKKPAPAAPAAKKPEPKPEPPPPPPPPPGVKLTTTSTQGAQVSQNITYLQGTRQRVEFPGVVTIDQCDLKRSVMLNVAAKKYRAQPYADPKPAAPPVPSDPQAKPRGGVITFVTVVDDTDERQTLFGLEARRIKSSVTKQWSNTACDKTPLSIEIDAWYVELPEQTACARPAAVQPPAPSADGCADTIETRIAGTAKLGFPIKMTTSTTTGEGGRAETTTTTQEVTALDITRLDRELFDVPADFVEGANAAEVVPAIAKGGSVNDALFGSVLDGTSTAAPRKPGIVRVGVLQPVNKADRALPGESTLRDDLVARFSRPGYEAVPLAGASPVDAAADAARLGCDIIIQTEIVEAKTSKPGRLGGLTKITGSTPRDSNEVKVDYKVFAVSPKPTQRFTGDVKGTSGGFGLGSALRLAAFAGQLYMNFMMGGMGMGMMSPMSGGMSSGGGRLFDPRASAMSMLSGFAAGDVGFASADAGMREAVTEAMGNGARAAMEQLARSKGR